MLRAAVHAAVFLSLVLPASASGQWGITAKAALPALPYWWPVDRELGIDIVPSLWTNEVDGASSGCCVIGAATRQRIGPGYLWLGLAVGTDPEAGAPAALEAAAELQGGLLAFRRLHGRHGVAALYPLLGVPERDATRELRVSFGVSAVWIYDERYLPTLPFFDCPADAPAVPCAEVERPYAWSEGRDQALLAEGAWGRGRGRAPRVSGSLLVGLGLAGADHEYLRAELEARTAGSSRSAEWTVRVAGGWSSGAAPQQRRFFLAGTDPINRWLNPYLEAREALLEDIPYFVPGGGHLRAYQETQPLIKRYVGAAAEFGRAAATRWGLRGRASAFLEAAWTPGLPDRLGPESLRENGPLLFDWRQLPVGEGKELGQFRARSLGAPELWADAGLALTAGYDRLSLTVSFPLWVSEPAFAGEPIGGGAKKALALRWTWTVRFVPHGTPGG